MCLNQPVNSSYQPSGANQLTSNTRVCAKLCCNNNNNKPKCFRSQCIVFSMFGIITDDRGGGLHGPRPRVSGRGAPGVSHNLHQPHVPPVHLCQQVGFNSPHLFTDYRPEHTHEELVLVYYKQCHTKVTLEEKCTSTSKSAKITRQKHVLKTKDWDLTGFVDHYFYTIIFVVVQCLVIRYGLGHLIQSFHQSPCVTVVFPVRCWRGPVPRSTASFMPARAEWPCRPRATSRTSRLRATQCLSQAEVSGGRKRWRNENHYLLYPNSHRTTFT